MGERMAVPLGWRVNEPWQLTAQSLVADQDDELGGVSIGDGEEALLLLDAVGSPAEAARAYRAVAKVLLERARALDGRDPARPKGWT